MILKKGTTYFSINNFTIYYVNRFDLKFTKIQCTHFQNGQFGVHVNLRRRIVQYENTYAHILPKKCTINVLPILFIFILSSEPILKLA